MAGVIISDSTMEIKMPPMTAIASGCNICEPAPQARDNGIIPATAAIAVITMGRSRRRVYRATPQGRKALAAAKKKVWELFHELLEEAKEHRK